MYFSTFYSMKGNFATIKLTMLGSFAHKGYLWEILDYV